VVKAAWRRRDDVYRALPSDDTARRRCRSQDWGPPLPLPPLCVPPPSSRARFVWSSAVGKRVSEAGVAVVDRLDSRRLELWKPSFTFQDAMFKRGETRRRST